MQVLYIALITNLTLPMLFCDTFKVFNLIVNECVFDRTWSELDKLLANNDNITIWQSKVILRYYWITDESSK